MRPRFLRISAFGPFADTTELDFGELGDSRFFLIHGATGAGKTSILDALCFALYGQPTGRARDPAALRSDHAAPDTPTEVQFDFSLRGRHYRVVRNPRYLRPKKRGEGMKEERERAELSRLSIPGPKGAVEEVLATRRTEVDRAVQELLRLTCDQFRQVVVLPQGEFLEFLLAGSGDKQAILETLFDAAHLKRVQNALRAAALSQWKKLQEVQERQRELLGTHEAVSEEDLERRLDEAGHGLDEVERQLAALETRIDSTTRELDEARAREQCLERLERARSTVRGLEARKQEVDQLRERHRRAVKARPVADLWDRLERERAQLEAARRERDHRGAECDRLAREAEQALAALQSEEEKTPRCEELRREITRLEDAREGARNLADVRRSLDVARARAEEKERYCAGLDRKRSVTAAEVRSLEDQIPECRARAARFEELLSLREEEKRVLETVHALCAGERELAGARVRREEAARAVAVQRDSREEARSELKEAEEQYRGVQGGLLAAFLQEGQPCPVCGSTVHPSPAHLRQGEGPAAGRLDDLRKRKEAAESRLEKLRVEEARACDEVERLQRDVLRRREELPDGEVPPPEEQERRLREVEQRLGEARRAREEEEELAKRLADRREEYERLDEEAVSAREQSGVARAQVERLEGEVRGLEKGLPQDLRSVEDVAEGLRRSREELQSLEDGLHRARTHQQEIEAALIQARTRLEEGAFQCLQLEENHTQDEARFAVRLEEEGFTGPQDFEAARLETSEIAELELRLKEHDTRLAAAREALAEAEREVQAVGEPEGEGRDPAGLEQALAGLRKEKGDLQVAKGEHRRTRDSLQQALQRYRSHRETEEAIRERHEVLSGLDRIASSREMDFQRYVLAYILEQVLQVASLRLYRMSRGRYHLERETGTRDRRMTSGLDLCVHDAYTGKLRTARSLSGGEGFLASLSLALGLAEVVQHFAGGVHVDALFIDEGFGSLDAEALDLSVETLMGLREGGRLVGVISHVPGLRERIDVRLEVTSGRNGSRARFVTP